MIVHVPLEVELIDINAEMINGKRWYTTPEGEKYPSITSVLGSEEKQYLTDWRNMLGPKKADAETKRCSDRGTAVHLMAERYLDNEPDFTREQTHDNIKLFNKLKLVLKKINNIRMQEAPLYSDELRVAGRVDCIAEYDGVLSIIDFKTSNNNKTEAMVLDYFLQETFYALAYYELTGTRIDQIVTLIAVEKGSMPLIFKRNISQYIMPLLKRIDTFYKTTSKERK